MKCYKLAGVFTLFSVVSLAQSNPVRLDGVFEDWNDIEFVEGPSQTQLSITELAIYNDEAFLYIRLRLNGEIILQNGPIELWIDGDNDRATGEAIADMGAEFYYHFGEKRGLFLGRIITQDDIAFIPLPTHSSDEFELRISRTVLPLGERLLFPAASIKMLASAGPGNFIPTQGTLEFSFLENETGSSPDVTLAREENSSLRLAAYNILRDRPLVSGFTDEFQRMIQAIAADIYCFNEFYESSAAQVKNLMDQTVDSGNEQGWYATKVDEDNVTVSRYPIRAALKISQNGNMSANLIKLPEPFNSDILVINCHTICCNSEEIRQEQVDAIMAFILEAKQAGGRMDIASNTPIIVAGDLNLVGFKQQLLTLLNGSIVNEQTYGSGALPDWDGTPFEDLIPLHTDQALAITWRNPNSEFPPGRLDFIIYSDSQLRPVKSYVLETTAMDASKRVANGLLSSDAFLSDHLPLVSDFEFINTTTAVNELDTKPIVKVFPNPATDVLQVFREKAGKQQEVLIRAADGKLVWSGFLKDNTLFITLKNWKAGLYFLQIGRRGKTIPFVKK